MYTRRFPIGLSRVPEKVECQPERTEERQIQYRAPSPHTGHPAQGTTEQTSVLAQQRGRCQRCNCLALRKRDHGRPPKHPHQECPLGTGSEQVRCDAQASPSEQLLVANRCPVSLYVPTAVTTDWPPGTEGVSAAGVATEQGSSTWTTTPRQTRGTAHAEARRAGAASPARGLAQWRETAVVQCRVDARPQTMAGQRCCTGGIPRASLDECCVVFAAPAPQPDLFANKKSLSSP